MANYVYVTYVATQKFYFFLKEIPLILFITNRDDVNRVTTQIEIEANKIFDDVYWNNINRDDVNRGNTLWQNINK